MLKTIIHSLFILCISTLIDESEKVKSTFFKQEGLYINGLIINKSSYLTPDSNNIYTVMKFKVLDILNDEYSEQKSDTINIVYWGGTTKEGYYQEIYVNDNLFTTNHQHILIVKDDYKPLDGLLKEYYFYEGEHINIVNTDLYFAAGSMGFFKTKEILLDSFCLNKGFNLNDIKVEIPFSLMYEGYKTYNEYVNHKRESILKKQDSLIRLRMKKQSTDSSSED